MDTDLSQLDPELRRNLAITLGAQQPQLAALRAPAGPEMAAPGPITLPGQDKVPNLAISAPAVSSLGGKKTGTWAPQGTIPGDKQERARQISTGAGVDQIYGKVTGSDFGQDHPIAGKALGGLAQGIGKLGDIGLSAVAPALAINLPGTEFHHAAQLHGLNKQIGAEEGEQEKEAQAAASQSEIPFRQAETEHEQAQTQELLNPQPKPKEESWKVVPEFTGPKGEPIEVEQNSGQIKVGGQVEGIKPSKTAKEATPQQETYDSLLKQGFTPLQAYEKIREKPAGTTGEGTWSLQEDKDGNPILLNSKTGEAKPAPAGIAKSGTHAKAEAAQKKEMEPIEGAVGYATDYLKNGTFTGPGDEALQEKFFELAKPSTGFRMTQQQMAMLANSRSWMGGLEGHLRHATSGTWFSDEQRQQIVDTMNQLANEKRKAAGSAPQGTPQGGTPAAPVATHRWNPATGEVEEIKK